MGAWGVGTFEDDLARDWLSYLEESDDPPYLTLGGSLLPPESDGHLETLGGIMILCAAEMIHALVYGPREGLSEEAMAWIEKHRGLDVSVLTPFAAERIDRVLAEGSELNELWSENEQEYDQWRQNVLALQRALRKPWESVE